jgi:hypothetical protein
MGEVVLPEAGVEAAPPVADAGLLGAVCFAAAWCGLFAAVALRAGVTAGVDRAVVC